MIRTFYLAGPTDHSFRLRIDLKILPVFKKHVRH
jgi:hypothetical protein